MVKPGKDEVGRNDPCPCGSGKKYKKCCGAVTDIVDIGKATDAIRFNKIAGYIGAVGRKREGFCRSYIEHKRNLLDVISQVQAKKAALMGKSVACQRGCTACCDEIIHCSVQEGEGIVYYLYHNEHALNSFTKAFPRWLAEARRHEDVLLRIEQAHTKGFDGEISLEKMMQSEIGERAMDYWKLHIPCPFLSNDACSIYEVRPWVCVNLFATSKCDSSSKEQKTLLLDLPATIEQPYWDERIEVIYQDLMPNMVYKMLIGGFRFLTQIPGLENIFKEYISDPEVRKFGETLKSR